MANYPCLGLCAGVLVLGVEAAGQASPTVTPPAYAVLEDVPAPRRKHVHASIDRGPQKE